YQTSVHLLTPYCSSPLIRNVSSTPLERPSKSYRNSCSCKGAFGIPYTLLLEVYNSTGSVSNARAVSRTLNVPRAFDLKSSPGPLIDLGTDTWAAAWTMRSQSLAAAERDSRSPTPPLTTLRRLPFWCDLSHSTFRRQPTPLEKSSYMTTACPACRR